MPVQRSSTMVAPEDPLILTEPAPRFVSRGGLKLDGALRDLGVEVAGRRWIDAGASTGGFTDRLLQGGAAEVLAVDVGYGQLDWELRNDPRVIVLERTNIRSLDVSALPWRADGVVADLSFISLTHVLGVLGELSVPEADLVVLVKPQFEVGREQVGRRGVVTDPDLWRVALERVATSAQSHGFRLRGVTVSDIKGPAGNTEFFMHLRKDGDDVPDAIERALETATA